MLAMLQLVCAKALASSFFSLNGSVLLQAEGWFNRAIEAIALGWSVTSASLTASAGYGLTLVFLLGLAIGTLSLCIAHRRVGKPERGLVDQQLSESQGRLSMALVAGRSDTWSWHHAENLLRVDNQQQVINHTGKALQWPMDKLPIHPDDYPAAKAKWQAHLQGEEPYLNLVCRVKSGDHQWRWVQISGAVIERDPHGEPILISGIYTDVTEHRQLQQESGLLAQALANTSEGLLVMSAEFEVLQGNPAAERILRLPALDGVRFSQLLPHHTGDWQQRLRDGHWRGELQMCRGDGTEVPVWLTMSPMEGHAQHIVALFSDMTERKQAEQELRQLADFDPLTQLANRAKFVAHLRQQINQRSSSERMALLFLDLDRFKHINDTYGHSCGDELLVEAAQRLQKVVRGTDMLCRFGGDEFLILVSDIPSETIVNELGQRILDSIAQPFWIDQQPFYISTSIGVAMWPQDGDQSETLIKHADLAMYHAKEDGRGRFCFYSQQRDAQATYQLDLVNALRTAIERESLNLCYQPQVDLHSNRVIGIEALLRWQGQDGQAISPAQFIPLAESCGLVVALDRWALQQACQTFVGWNLRDGQTLSVNVSGSHFHQVDYVDFVASVLKQTNMPPMNLCIEITEGVLIKQVPTARKQLDALRRLGVNVAVDDFGTGYSSLAYLAHFAVDELKIDRSFVKELPERGNSAIIRTVVDLGRNLGLRVIAEGVESPEQEEQLLRLGCRRMQGYLYSRPLSSEACYRFLMESSRHGLPPSPGRRALTSTQLKIV
ncbi:putative bifunctional diguanylate cyclase/phosphodiesterase [Ferrimonas senticii]|uniref:putative bifunctional diguanylate cyclase/phosphodiesterase n=1 Tax=Ferrimonas senticii TaxID=394566 RepID=UPI0004123FFB|nr:bifunctional diguanylate cyclase/phosphodiesterase [Ferrimonas senticii]